MIDRSQSTADRVDGDPDATGRQRAQQLGRRVGVDRADGARAPRRSGRPARPAGAGRSRPRPARARTEQLGEQLVMHVGAPRQAGGRHLGRGQAARRLRGRQQGEPGGQRIRRDAALLAGVRGDDVGEHLGGRPGWRRAARVLERQLTRLLTAGRSGRYRADQPGHRRGTGPGNVGAAGRTAVASYAAIADGTRHQGGQSAVTAGEQALRQLDVVTPGHPHARPQQRRVQRSRRRPDPPDVGLPGPRCHRRGKIRRGFGRAGRGAALSQRPHDTRSSRTRDNRYPHT